MLISGTSSWSEPSWVGAFYPEGTKPAEFLAHYARQFPAVEADVTYYRVPDERLVAGWDRRTPPGFRIAAKFPRTIVHGGDGARPDPARLLVPAAVEADLTQFLESMRLLGPKCGPLIMQFPFFNDSVFRNAGEFFKRLDAFLSILPKDLRYGVEIRNKLWINAPFCDLLRRHDVALVLVDIAYMPHPAALADRLDLVTTDFVYARLIGDRKAIDAMTSRFDRIVVDSGPRLQRWAELLKRYLVRVPQVFVFANNHYAGHGPATIRDLASRIGG